MVQQHTDLLRGCVIKAVAHSAARASNAPQTGSRGLDTSGATAAQDASQGPNIPARYSGAQSPSAGAALVTTLKNQSGCSGKRKEAFLLYREKPTVASAQRRGGLRGNKRQRKRETGPNCHCKKNKPPHVGQGDTE